LPFGSSPEGDFAFSGSFRASAQTLTRFARSGGLQIVTMQTLFAEIIWHCPLIFQLSLNKSLVYI
jgi:hypothetical protein